MKFAVGIDIDEPIYPWLDAQHKYCIKILGLPEDTPPPRSWHPYKEYKKDGKGISIDEWYDILGQGAIDGEVYNQDVHLGVADEIQRLKDADGFVHLVTSRGALAHRAKIKIHTIEMLERFNIPYDALSFTTEKGHIWTDYFLDDHPKYLDQVSLTLSQGYLLNHPHNADYEGRYPRVDSLKEFVDAVLEDTRMRGNL